MECHDIFYPTRNGACGNWCSWDNTNLPLGGFTGVTSIGLLRHLVRTYWQHCLCVTISQFSHLTPRPTQSFELQIAQLLASVQANSLLLNLWQLMIWTFGTASLLFDILLRSSFTSTSNWIVPVPVVSENLWLSKVKTSSLVFLFWFTISPILIST